ERQPRGDHRVAAVGDVAERTAVYQCGRTLERLYEIRLDRILHEDRHRARGTQVGRGHGRAVGGLSDDYAPGSRLEVGEIGRQAQDRHHLRRHRDLEAALARDTVRGTTEPEHDVPKGPVVHVHHALEQHAARVDAERVALREVVVEHRGQQIVRRAGGMHVAGEMQINVFHRRELRVTATRRATLHTEHGT